VGVINSGKEERRVESFENVWSHLAREVADPLSVSVFSFFVVF
jgi:hypothetical protein